MRLGSRARLTITLGLIAATLFLLLGVRELRRASAAEGSLAKDMAAVPAAPVVVLARAAQAIRTGETISPAMIRSAAGDPGRHPAIATAAEVAGKVAARDIPAGALIARAALGSAAGLAIRVPVGMRAVSIDTTAEIAVAGLVRPGDRVDVQVVYPGADAISGARGSGRSRAQALLQLVPVLAVGESVVGAQQGSDGVSGEPSSPPPPARTVTLALTPDQVSILSLAKSTGALTLSLRNPADAARPAVAVAASAGVEPAPPPPIASAPSLRATPQAPPRRAPHAIELVVGDRRETIYSGSASR